MIFDSACDKPPIAHGTIFAWLLAQRVDVCAAEESAVHHCPGSWLLFASVSGTARVTSEPATSRKPLMLIDRTANAWRWSCADGWCVPDLPKITAWSNPWPDLVDDSAVGK